MYIVMYLHVHVQVVCVLYNSILMRILKPYVCTRAMITYHNSQKDFSQCNYSKGVNDCKASLKYTCYKVLLCTCVVCC